MATLNENVAKTKADFKAIKDELVNKGASISSETPTSQYANIIKNMSTGSSEEAYEQGRQDVISKSKYIPKTAIGKVISLTDVSEVYHKVKVVGVGNEVKVYGKNLLPYPYRNTSAVTVSGVTITPNEDGSIHVKGTSTATCALKLLDSLDLKDGVTYTICDNSNNWAVYFAYVDETGTQRSPGGNATTNVTSFIWKEGYEQLGVYIQMLAGKTVDETIYPMLSFANSDLKWEPYKEPQTITATPVGTEIDSMCPNMNFFADGELDILVEYFSSFGMAEKELAMWNSFTNYGNRTTYTYAFAYVNFEGYAAPEGLIKNPKRINSMFQAYEGRELPKGVDLSTFVPDGGYVAYCATSLFNTSTKIEKIYDLKIPETNLSYTQAYYGCKNLKEIEMHRSGENTVYDTKTFQGCTSLTHVIFSGVIASDINLQWSKLLDEESLQSLTQSLADFIIVGNNPTGSNIAEGQAFTKTITLSPESWAILDNLEFIPPEGSGYPTGFSCTNIITTAKGWNKA